MLSVRHLQISSDLEILFCSFLCFDRLFLFLYLPLNKLYSKQIYTLFLKRTVPVIECTFQHRSNTPDSINTTQTLIKQERIYWYFHIHQANESRSMNDRRFSDISTLPHT